MSATPVLVAAAGAGWEAAALARLDRAPEVALARRCVDLTDLLAAAGVGLGTVAVVDSGLPGLDADALAGLRRCGVGVVVVAAPDELDDGDVGRLRRLGADHLLVETELDALVTTVREAGEGLGPSPSAVPDDVAGLGRAAPARPHGRLLAVWGPTGAPGRTTVAVGLATGLAGSGDVLLVDADPYGGAVAQHLGVLEEVSGLLAAARAANTGQLGPDRLAGLARQIGPGLRVLTGLPRPDRWQEVRPAAYADLLDEAAGLADHVVLDLGFSLETQPGDPFGSTPQRNEMTLAALERADEVVVVGSADPVGLSRLARGLVELSELVPGVRPRVVVNRTRASLGWSDRDVRGMVEGFVRPLDVHFLPDDRVAADRAVMTGRSLAEGGESPLLEAVTALVAAILGGRPATASRRRFRPRGAGRAR